MGLTRIMTGVAGLLLSVLLTGGGALAAFPEKPIQFIIGWQAGDGTDLSARTLCNFAEKFIKHPLVPSNLSGGSGGKAYATIAAAKPDGYTIGTTTSSISTLKPLGMVDVDSTNVQPIIAYSEDPTGLWVRHDSPWKTLEEFVTHARNNPGQVRVAASNPGSITRFQMIALEQNAGIEFRILSGGNAPGMIALAGGHVDAAFGTPPTGASLYGSQKIRPLGFTSAKRIPYMPEVPTFVEQGFDVVMTTNRMVIAPKDTPQEIVNALYTIFKQAVDTPEYRSNMESRGTTWLDWDPATCRAYLEKQDALYKELIKKAGLDKGGKQ